jgi:hypothetical protein
MRTTRRDFVKGVSFGAAGLAIARSSQSRASAPEKLKYDEYFHDFVYRKGNRGPGDADFYFRMNGKDLNGRNTNFSFGYYSKAGAWDTSEPAGETHPFNECLVFAGLDPKDPNYLGAEVEVALGKNYERYVIDVPSIVCIPKDLPHGPIVTRKVEKPFAFYSIGLAADYQAIRLKGKPGANPGTQEYGHLVKKMSKYGQPGANKIGPGNADWLMWPKSKDLEGFIVNFTWGFYNGLGNWHNIPGFDPHVHEGDEFLCYVGLDPKKPEYLGADIEFHMGKDEEVHWVRKPLVTVAPSMFTHAPIITHKVDKTYAFFLIRTDTGETYSPKKQQATKP